MNKLIKATKQYSASDLSEKTGKVVEAALKAPLNKVLAEIYKNSLVSVTGALQTYANALHNDRAHPFPFAACPKEECKCGRAVIDGAIAVVTKDPQVI